MAASRRQDSVAKAFAQVSKSASIIVIHDAARPFATADLFTRVIEAAAKGGAAIAALQASDTVKEATAAPGVRIVARTIARESIYLAQTPQAFSREVLEARHRARARKHRTRRPTRRRSPRRPATRCGWSTGNRPISKSRRSTICDVSKALLDRASAIRDPHNPSARVGTGYDLHRLEAGRPLIIGGVAYSARDRPCGTLGCGRAVSCGDRRDSRRGRRGRHRPALSRHRSEMERREQHRAAERRGGDRARGRLRGRERRCRRHRRAPEAGAAYSRHAREPRAGDRHRRVRGQRQRQDERKGRRAGPQRSDRGARGCAA